MNQLEKDIFNELIKDREESSRAIKKKSMRGVEESVVQKYSEKAHFIYELLQNADDCNATEVHFELHRDGLRFWHNGSVHFSIISPSLENDDTYDGPNGHINAIVAIGNSAKGGTQEYKIGKFGVGFKAVFQYTSTPYIYDDNFYFYIKDLIVPVMLDFDDGKRKQGETLFYFPFNKDGMSAEQAYNEISEKLQNLQFPLLFLNHLKNLYWSVEGLNGEYNQKEETLDGFDAEVRKVKQLFTSSVPGKSRIEKLILFSRVEETKSLKYSVGFMLNDEEDSIIPMLVPVMCYFPTAKSSGLNFIVHAPFQLIDNREGLNDNTWNKGLIKKLAELAAESLLPLCSLHLVHDNIFDIVPYRSNSAFSFEHDFYVEFEKVMKSQPVIPCQDGEYVTAGHAYWPSSKTVTEFLPQEQLRALVKDKEARWVFVKNNYKTMAPANRDLAAYLDRIIKDEKTELLYIDNTYKLVGRDRKHRLDESAIFTMFDSFFIEAQPLSWLHLLYKYLLEVESSRKEVKTKPIFLNTNKKAVAAFKYDRSSKSYERTLFIDTVEGSNLPTLLPELLENETTREFIKEFGIGKPNLRDEIYNDILPMYVGNQEIDTSSHFRKFYEYYKICPKENMGSFLDMIRDKEFINSYDCRIESPSEEDVFRNKPIEVYFGSEGLKEYFSGSSETVWFLDEESFEDLYNEFGKENVQEFMEKLGVRRYLRKMERRYIDVGCDSSYLYWLEWHKNITVRSKNIIDYYFPLFEDNLDNLTKVKSLEIWKAVLYEIENVQNVSELLQGRHVFAYKTDKFDSYLLWMIKNKAWLFDKEGRVCKPADILLSDLDGQYDLISKSAKLLCGLLPFNVRKASIDEALTKARTILDEDAIVKLLEEATRAAEKNGEEGDNAQIDNSYDIKRQELQEAEEGDEPNENNEGGNEDSGLSMELDPKKIEEEIRKRLEEDAKKKQDRKSLVDSINNSKKYSHDWFWNYIKLMATYSEKLSQDNKASLSFASITPEKNNKRFFILDGSGRYIPEGITEAEGVSIQLMYSDGSASDIIDVEGVSRIGQKIQILTKNEVSDLVIGKMSSVTRIDFNYTPVVNLLNRLQVAFANPYFVDKWDDIKEALPSIRYIYGPPGTGKTWTIGKKIETITEGNKAHILVLTPTNTAADEVCKKLRDGERKVNAVRLSKATNIELQEMGGVYFDSLSMTELEQIPVVASTIHRLPYFELQGDEDNDNCKLFQYPWDYVVFDESSMIGLHYIVFAIMAIYKVNKRARFIVAGDPMQIPPIVEITDDEIENFSIQDENIYKMMGVSSFENTASQIRSKDEVENLNMQRRSVPSIGQLYSDLSYSSLLKHFRPEKPEKELPMAFQSIMKTAVTFIDMPLVKTVDAYRIFKLHGSSYHFYSAIMVMEMLKRFDAENSKGQNQEWSIGLISPYKAQAILMDKLVSSYGFSSKLRVVSDTVHGFQGGECDIVFFVCNPNSYALGNMNGKMRERCLMFKQYIYNVAISRARDYLVVIHPFSWERNNLYINRITNSYRLINGRCEFIPFRELELKLFGVMDYIKNNSYVTSHDAVNVYNTILGKKYILKYGVDSLDVQVIAAKAEEMPQFGRICNSPTVSIRI